MATSYDLNVSGPDGKPDPVTPVNGKSATPLGPEGNGADGKATYTGKCESPAGPGQPGNHGCSAPPATAGANGLDAFSVVITCDAYSGAPLKLLNAGGTGAAGNSGGRGGDGSDGGNAGKQPKACTGTIPGGYGGGAGNGGNAGTGGNGGNAGDIVVVYGPGFTDTPVSADSQGGTTGASGTPGDPGTPGKGGLDSAGDPAPIGATGDYGNQPGTPTAGYGGSFVANQDNTKPSTYLKVSVSSHVTP